MVSPFIMIGTQFVEIFPGALGVDDPTHPYTIRDRLGNIIVTGDHDRVFPLVGDPVLPIRTNLNMKAADAVEATDVVTLGVGGGGIPGDWFRRDGTTTLLGDWDLGGAGHSVLMSALKARAASSLTIGDDTNTNGVRIAMTTGDVHFGPLGAGASKAYFDATDGSLIQDAGAFVQTDEVRAVGASGLSIFDSTGAAGMVVASGGDVSLTHDLALAAAKKITGDVWQLRNAVAGFELMDTIGNAAVMVTGSADGGDLLIKIGDIDTIGLGTLVAIDNGAGSITLTGAAIVGILTINDNATQADAKYIATDQVRARDGDGLKLYDDASNGIFVEDGGQVGIAHTSPLGLFDIAREARTGTDPVHAPPLYVTWSGSASSVGVEFRHSNQTQGIGFGYNSIYATGSIANQGLGLFGRGTRGVAVGTTTPDGLFEVQTTATWGSQAVTIDQDDADQAFIDFQGSSGAGVTNTVNTTERSTYGQMLMIEVNGVKRWLKAYQ